MSTRDRIRRSRRGFTMIEALATIVILGAIGTVASGIIFAATDGYLSASTSAQLHTEVSIATDRMARELRNIQLDPDAAGVAPDIDTVSATSIAWDDNSSIALNGSDLMLSIGGGAPAVLLSDVTAFVVQTFDEDNSALAANLNGDACDPIRRISILTTVQRFGVSESLRTRVYLRSTMAGAGG